jgi:hypothetical protein
VAVFVLDELDLFARRSKQAVLYNLLDALLTSGMQVGHALSPRRFAGHSARRVDCAWG